MIRLSESRGFTLIELLVVIAIIGTLASVILASLSVARSKGRDANRLAQLREVRTALEMHYHDNGGQYPLDSADRSGGTIVTYLLSDISPDIVPRYLPALPLDPTRGNTSNGYRYGSSASGNMYVILVQLEENAGAWCEIRSPAGDPHFSYSPC